MGSSFPDLSGKSPEHCLVEALQITRLLLESAPNNRKRKSLRILDLALLNAIDDLEQLGASTQFIPGESRAVSELSANTQQASGPLSLLAGPIVSMVSKLAGGQ